MARRKTKYPDTGWGREAEWEDLKRLADPQLHERAPKEYKMTFDRAKEMKAAGKTREETISALNVTAKSVGMAESVSETQMAKVNQRVEAELVLVRSKAIDDAFEEREPHIEA